MNQSLENITIMDKVSLTAEYIAHHKKEDFLSDAATQESRLPAASDVVNTRFCRDPFLRAETSILRSPGGNFVQLCC